jgi:hypothetical protein
MECMDCKYRGNIKKEGAEIAGWHCTQRDETVYNNEFTKRAHCWFRK